MQPRIPVSEKGTPVGGQSLLHDVSLPAAVVFESPLLHNIAWMQRFADQRDSQLAPHGKTTMTPALFRRQLAAGAWGITLATATQCAAAFAHGVARLLMANQLVGPANMDIVADLIGHGADYYCLVDSVANVQALDRHFAARALRLNVLIEIGVTGGRCGVRGDADLAAVATAIHAAPALRLCGVEGYEGMLHGDDAARQVRAYGDRLVDSVRNLDQSGAFDGRRPIVTAAGSRWYDLIADAFRAGGLQRQYTPLLRPGCYVTHDHRLYRDAMREVQARQPDLEGALEPALAVYARVQSLPERGTAIVAMGKRDVACDPDLPMPLTLYREGQAPRAFMQGQVRALMDQHALLETAPDADLAIGDVIAFGTSHPCLTFDKWRQVLLVDDALQVREVMPTYF